MGKQIAKLEPLALPPAHRPTMIPSLPEWAARLRDAVRPEGQFIQDPESGRKTFQDVLVLPAHLIPNADQANAMMNHIDSLSSYLRQTPVQDPTIEDRTATAITKLLLVLPSSRKSETGAEIRSEVYLDVLDDVPCWAVEAAIRRWHRHDCGNDERGRPHDYKWAPDPGTVRAIAMQESRGVEARIEQITRVLTARPYVDCSADMERGRLAMMGLNKSMSDPAALAALTFDKAVAIGTQMTQPPVPEPSHVKREAAE